MFGNLFNKWNVKFGKLGKDGDGGDYVTEKVSSISKSLNNRYGVVFWKVGVVEFEGSIANYLPQEPKKIEEPYLERAKLTKRGFYLERSPETYKDGAVRIITVDESDPVGKYEQDVIVNGKVIKTITYKVVE